MVCPRNSRCHLPWDAAPNCLSAGLQEDGDATVGASWVVALGSSWPRKPTGPAPAAHGAFRNGRPKCSPAPQRPLSPPPPMRVLEPGHREEADVGPGWHHQHHPASAGANVALLGAISPPLRRLYASCALVHPAVLAGWCRWHARARRTRRPRGLCQGHPSSRLNGPPADLQVLGDPGAFYMLPPPVTCVEAPGGPIVPPQVHGLLSTRPTSLCSSYSC